MLIKVLISIVLAIVAGLLTSPDSGIGGVTFLQIYTLIGQLFLNALTLVVVPLVASSIITGAARMGSDGSAGTLGVKTFGYFILTSLLAILVGLAIATLIEPGISQGSGNLSSEIQMADTPRFEALKSQGEGNSFDKIAQIFLKLVPSNILAVASQGQMLGLIFFSLIFGYFISKIEPHPASIILGFWKGIFQIMMQITHLVMKAMPIGVFGLVAKVVATTGAESLKSVALFTLTVLAGLFIHMCIILPFLLKFVAKVSPIAHFKAMAPALLTAFSTSSSAASLPVIIECVEKRAHVSNRICSFTVPLGTSLNLSGSALHVCVAVLFIAQIYGIDLSFSNILVIILMTLLASIGTAGIPSACLITVVLILHTLGIPAEALGLILAVERILDMCRTTVNAFSNSCCAVLVAKAEGEKDILVPAAVS